MKTLVGSYDAFQEAREFVGFETLKLIDKFFEDASGFDDFTEYLKAFPNAEGWLYEEIQKDLESQGYKVEWIDGEANVYRMIDEYAIEAHYIDTDSGRRYMFQVVDSGGEVIEEFPVDYDLSEYITEI